MNATANFEAITLTPGTAVCVGQITSPSGNINKMVGFTITCNGVSSTAKRIPYQVVRQTGGTGTTNNPVKLDDNETMSLQSTGLKSVSGQTDGAVLDSGYIDPMLGLGKFYPDGFERNFGNGGKIGFVLTQPSGETAVSATVVADFEE